ELQCRDHGGEHVDETDRRMTVQQMSAALPAIGALAERRLLERRDMFGSGCDPHRIGLPEREGIDRRACPRPAGTAVTIAHRFRRTGDLDGNSAAKAASDMAHDGLLMDRYNAAVIAVLRLRSSSRTVPSREIDQLASLRSLANGLRPSQVCI